MVTGAGQNARLTTDGFFPLLDGRDENVYSKGTGQRNEKVGQKGTIRDKVNTRHMQEKTKTQEIAIYGSDDRGHLCKTAICKWDPKEKEHYLEMKQGHRYIKTPISVIRDAEEALKQSIN